MKPIDNVTTDRLDVALRMCGIQINRVLIDRIIDLVELIEDKGSEVALSDIGELQDQWREKIH
jgi:hypothetical protein